MSGPALLVLASICFAWVAAAQPTYEVGNEAVSRHIVVEDGQLRPLELVNRRTGRRVELGGEAFGISYVVPEVRITPPEHNTVRLHASQLRVDSVYYAESEAGQEQLVVALHAEEAPLAFELVYQADAERPVVHKQLRWRQTANAAEGPYFVEDVWMEDVRVSAPVRGGGHGQPIFTDDVFWGVEYPGSHAEPIEGGFRIHYAVGRNATAEWQESYPAVAGAGDEGFVEHDFKRYVNSIRPNPVEPYLLYNSWYDIRDFNYEEIFERIRFFDEVLLDEYGQRLDALVLDDGWDNLEGPLWSVDEDKFPNGLDPVGDRLRDMGSTLGLWASPWGGYDAALLKRAELAAEEGYEKMGAHLCLAGSRYYDLFHDTLLDYQQRYNVGFWKLDGFLSTCNRMDHGHLPGRFSRREQLDAFLSVLGDLRAARPDVRIDITVGTWQSPWWLKWADYVWMGGGDYGLSADVPSRTRRDQALTFRDQVMYDDLVSAGYVMPTSAFMTHGIIKGRLNMLGGADERPEAFIKNAVMYFSRGVSMWELYLTPDRVADEEWAGLVQVMRWARDHWDLLQYTSYVGGAPRAGQPYGYAHFDDRRGLLTVRNPAPDAQRLTIPLDERLGKIDTTATWHVLHRYPQQTMLEGTWKAGERITVDLAPYEVAVYEFVPQEARPAAYVVGAPYRVDARNEHLEVLAADDSYSIHGASGARTIADASSRRSGPALEDASWRVEDDHLTGRLQLDGLEVLERPMLVLLLEVEEAVEDLEVRRDNESWMRGREEVDGRWWFEVPLDTTMDEVRLTFSETDVRGVQLLLEGTPARRVQRVRLGEAPPVGARQQLPTDWDRQRRLYPLSPMTAPL